MTTQTHTPSPTPPTPTTQQAKNDDTGQPTVPVDTAQPIVREVDGVRDTARQTRSRQCTAKNRKTGERCRRQAMIGLDVCYVHGGQLPQPKMRNAKAKMDRRAAKALAKFDPSTASALDDPVGELARVAGQVMYVLDHVIAMTADTDVDITSPAFAVLERGMDRASKLLVDLNKLGLAERQIAITEAQAAILITIVSGIVGDLGHDIDDPDVKQVVTSWLRKGHAIETGAT